VSQLYLPKFLYDHKYIGIIDITLSQFVSEFTLPLPHISKKS